MNFLKNLAVSLFSFLLFLSLTVFGVAFSVKATALNPDFVTAEISKLDIPALVEQVISFQPAQGQPDLNQIITQAVTRLQPQIKTQTNSAVRSVYDYELGNTPDPQLKAVLKNTFLSKDFVTSVINDVDISPLIEPAISQQVAQAIPFQVPNLDVYVTQALTAAEPSLKQQLIDASGPVSDYLVGSSQNLKVTLSLKEALASLKDVLRQAFVNSPPSGLVVAGVPVASIPQDQRGAAFDLYYPAIVSGIPTTYVIDNSVITPQVQVNIANDINNAEDGLRQARNYVAMFQQYYTWLIILMALLVLGIILIVRNVKDIAHRLGIPLVTYGAMEYGGIWVVKYLISSGRMQFPAISPPLDAWLRQLVTDCMKPLELFSLVLLIAGVALVVFSFVYKPKQDLKWS